MRNGEISEPTKEYEVEPYFSYYILTLLHLTYADSGTVLHNKQFKNQW